MIGKNEVFSSKCAFHVKPSELKTQFDFIEDVVGLTSRQKGLTTSGAEVRHLIVKIAIRSSYFGCLALDVTAAVLSSPVPLTCQSSTLRGREATNEEKNGSEFRENSTICKLASIVLATILLYVLKVPLGARPMFCNVFT